METEKPPRSILDDRPARVPTGGRIRTGIKVLTQKAASMPAVVAVYNRGLSNGLSFDAIDKAIESECRVTKALVPRNTPYFRIARADFTYPEIADRILDLYGEERDSEGRQLYRFPVIFAFDDWLQNMPNGLQSYGRSGLRYWSEYDAAGDRFCMEFAGADVDARNQRAKRIWGGRKPVIRQSNDGRCLPEQCPEYQCRACALKGRLLFYIPGIPGSSLIEINTSSIYSMQQIRGQMDLVAGIRGGRLAGTHGGRPLFYLTKVQSEVSMLDAEGKPKRTNQFLVHLESSIDMADVMSAREALPAPPPVAALMAAAPPPATATVTDATFTVSEPTGGAEAGISKAQIKGIRGEVFALVTEKGLDVEKFSKAMTTQHGDGWSRNPDKLATVKFDLEIGAIKCV